MIDNLLSITAAAFINAEISVSYDGPSLEARKNGMDFTVVDLDDDQVALLWRPAGHVQERGYRTFDIEGPSDVEDVIEEVEAKSSFGDNLPPVKVVNAWYYDDPVAYCLKRADLVEDPDEVVEEPYGIEDGRDLPDAYAVVKDVYRVERDIHTTPMEEEARKWQIRELLIHWYNLGGSALEDALEKAFTEYEKGLSATEAAQSQEPADHSEFDYETNALA